MLSDGEDGRLLSKHIFLQHRRMLNYSAVNQLHIIYLWFNRVAPRLNPVI